MDLERKNIGKIVISIKSTYSILKRLSSDNTTEESLLKYFQKYLEDISKEKKKILNNFKEITLISQNEEPLKILEKLDSDRFKILLNTFDENIISLERYFVNFATKKLSFKDFQNLIKLSADTFEDLLLPFQKEFKEELK